jgi:hypothetical protein
LTTIIITDEYLKTPNSHPVNFDPSAAYLDILKKEKKHIVSLNNISSIHKVPVDSLVRFRCMVQDTGLGQEMFISAYKKQDKNGDMNIHCYRYTDQHIEMPVRSIYL